MVKRIERWQVTADDREGRGTLLPLLKQRDDVSLKVKRLGFGDYRIENRLLVEHKTSRDLVASVIDGRLFSQAKRLRGSGMPALVTVSGPVTEPMRLMCRSAVLSLGLLFGLCVMHCRTPAEAIETMLAAARQISRAASGAVARHGFRPKGLRRQRLYVLQGLPGIGPDRAAALLDGIGTLENIFLADEEELAAVPGIGLKTARRIRHLVSGREACQSRFGETSK